MKATLALSTRIGVAILVSLAVVTAAVTAFVVANPKDALAKISVQVAASSTPTADPAGTDSRSAQAYARDLLANSQSAELGEWPERDLADLLPNRLYSFDGGSPAPLAAGIAIGAVTSAVGGAALDLSTGSAIDFTSATASARVVILSISLHHGLGEVSGRDSVQVGVRVNGDSDPVRLLDGMNSLGEVVVILDHPGRFGFDKKLYASRGGVRGLGLVSADGAIDFPALATNGAAFIGTLTHVDLVVEESGRSAFIGETTGEYVTGP